MSIRTTVIIVLLAAVAALAGSRPGHAQSCGQPPDPRTNTAGYASWCSCMGGSYNYQTTACVGARGPSGGGHRGGSSGTWGCLAEARNGAWGNSWEFGSENAARSRAQSECRARSKGSACSVSYCRTGITASNPLQPPGRKPAQSTPVRKPAYSCAVCAQKLRADLNAGLGSARIVTYTQQAIAGYQNCKRKAAPPCDIGDILVRTVENGCNGFKADDAAFRQCLGRTLGR